MSLTHYSVRTKEVLTEDCRTQTLSLSFSTQRSCGEYLLYKASYLSAAWVSYTLYCWSNDKHHDGPLDVVRARKVWQFWVWLWSGVVHPSVGRVLDLHVLHQQHLYNHTQ